MKLFLVYGFVLAGLCNFDLAESGPPIPHVYDGYTFGDPDAALHLEMFYDIMCPNCRSSFPSVKAIFEKLQKNGTKLKITLHTFPLPYHHNSFLAAQALQALGAKDHNLVIPWMEAVFSNQEAFGNPATERMSTKLVKEKFVQLAKDNHLPHQIVADGLDDSTADSNTRVSWKFGCYRSVFGTPTYHLNGVPTPEDAAGWSVNEWASFLEEHGQSHMVFKLPSFQTMS